mmetsp:Transcript_61198/g.114438  ORF Transcript_61198/g.114438 Transcript_61198/m.114438 type:complete len:107 (+) Transcript_61198:190-510(+)
MPISVPPLVPLGRRWHSSGRVRVSLRRNIAPHCSRVKHPPLPVMRRTRWLMYDRLRKLLLRSIFMKCHFVLMRGEHYRCGGRNMVRPVLADVFDWLFVVFLIRHEQ